MATQLLDLHDSLAESERRKVFEWLSSVNHVTHHRTKMKSLLPKSGQWLVEKQEFLQWRKSSVSSVLWLHGIPGSGKSMLVSSLIERLGQESPESTQSVPVAYFYCVRNTAEPERANPVEILRSILKQLSSSKLDLRIRKPVIEAYQKRKAEAMGGNPEKLMLDETVEVILALLETNSANIVIDALDECDPDLRHELFEALDTIIQRSASLVKVFVSSRDDGDICCRLTSSPNLFIQTSDNIVDIERFARTEVAQAIKKKRLIKGIVSSRLEDQIVNTLIDGARGMFRWVSLQIQNLCDWQRIKTEEQISQELGRLPNTLKESYDVIYKTISDSGPENSSLAVKVMKWLICAQRPLYSRELIAAISVDSKGETLNWSNDTLLDICRNMVVLDSEQDVFRFAHLSVREYLEGREDYTLLATHSLALERCVDVLTFELMLTPTKSTVKQNSMFQKYANLYWPVHCQIVERNRLADDLRQKLRQFLFQGCNASHLFTNWVSATCKSSSFFQTDLLRQSLREASSSPATPIFLACSFGLISVIDDLGTFKNTNWNQRNGTNKTGLHLASRRGHEAVVRRLIEDKADVNLRDNNRWTALSKAATEGHEAVVQLLLDAKADVNVQDIYGRTALSEAAGQGHEAVVQLLLEAKADVNAQDNTKRTALSKAATEGHEAVVQLLLEAKADVNVQDIYGRTALSEAAGQGHEAVVQLLLEAKADVNAQDNTKRTAICWAAMEGHEAVVQLLLEAKADVNVQDIYGRTELYWAAMEGHEAVVQLLLEAKADVNVQDVNGQTALSKAAAQVHEAVVQLLLEAKADVNVQDVNGQTALSKAAVRGHKAVVQLLLEAKADVNVQDIYGQTVLYWAAMEGHEAVVKLLLEAKADVNAQNNSKRTALYWAAVSGHEAVVQLLLEAKADVNVQDVNGQTALSKAAVRGHEAVVQLLLEAEADVNVQDIDRRTALSKAAMEGHEAVVQLLLDAKADVNVQDIYGRTALSEAAGQGHEAVVQLLLEAKADVNAQDNNKWTALYWAAVSGHEAIVHLLQDCVV